MDIISNRIVFLNINKDDEFFIKLSKKYKGRFYKKLKNSFGWSFPLEFKEQIESEYKNKNETKHISDSSNSDSDESFVENLNKDISESSSESSSSLENKSIVEENDSDSSSLDNDIIYLDKSTQTDDKVNYKYDIPSIIDENLKIYKNLI